MAAEIQVPLDPRKFCKALQDAGILPDSDFIRWVTISVDPHDMVTISLAMDADERLLSLVPVLAEGAKCENT